MGTCSTDDRPNFRAINNNNTSFSQNSHMHIAPLNDNEYYNKNTMSKTTNDFYKISRTKKKKQNKITKIDYCNIIRDNDNNTNKSTTSKSKSKNISETNSEHISKTHTMFSKQIKYKKFDMEQNDNDILDQEFKENFYKNKKKIRSKVLPSEKSLNIITEQDLRKMREERLKNKNNFNANDKLNYRCIKTYQAHNDKISCGIKLYNNKIATGSYDKTIIIWNYSDMNLIEENMLREQDDICCLLEFENNMLLTGTKSSNINLWNLNIGKIFYIFKGHISNVNDLSKLNNDFFASCSNDKTIRIWNYRTKLCTNILRGHMDGVLSLITLSDGKLCSGGGDLSIKIWNCSTGECTSTLLGHRKWVKCLCQLKNNNYILSGSDDKTIKVWSFNECIKTLIGHTNSVRTICQLNDFYFASGSFDKTIKIWDITNFDCTQTLLGHNDLVLIIIDINNEEMISCSNDHEIKLWGRK